MIGFKPSKTRRSFAPRTAEAAVPTFLGAGSDAEFLRKVPVYRRSVAVTILGSWHGSVVRM